MAIGKFKSTYDLMLEELAIEGTPLIIIKNTDTSEWYAEAVEREKVAQAKWDERKSQEEERIKGLACPNCQSTVKKHFCRREDNGVIGPGFASWVIEEYYICKGCGTHFQDVNKIELGRRPGNNY